MWVQQSSTDPRILQGVLNGDSFSDLSQIKAKGLGLCILELSNHCRKPVEREQDSFMWPR